MVQIISGTFGYYNGRKVIPITNADGPQNFDPGLEARLVKKGIAKYIGGQPDAPVRNTDGEEKVPEFGEDMKLGELKEVAAFYGVDTSNMRKKADIISAIETARAKTDSQTGDDEAPPQLDAAEPV